MIRGKLKRLQQNLKVKLVTLEFSAYALVWWYQIMYDVNRMRRPPCETWGDLKRELKERIVTTHYARNLYVKLKRLYQGLNGVEEYFKEMKICMMRA
ncbi:hypothetical protein CR513_04741, partial [Mucuna pruriens]